jgi:peptidoglycan hydrolase-like protein with peptidoglycan-binding domain
MTTTQQPTTSTAASRRHSKRARITAAAIGAVVVGAGVAGIALAGLHGPSGPTAGAAPTSVPPAAHTAPSTAGAPAHTAVVVHPSAAVAELQKELAELNYYEGPIDGIDGPATRQAITYLQRDAGLPQTGVMNAATEAALQNFLAHGNNQMNPASHPRPAPTPTPTPTPSAAITTLQKELGQLNYYEGPITGITNTQTTQAITYLQRDAGLPQTGQMNAATQAALQNFLAHGNNQMGS